MRKYIIYLFLSVIVLSCNSVKEAPKLKMSNDQLVELMVSLYAINSAISFNDETLQDSTKSLYYRQLAEISGISVEDIKSDFNLLLSMPDSLQLIQNRAVDTLNVLQERLISRPNLESLKVN